MRVYDEQRAYMYPHLRPLMPARWQLPKGWRRHYGNPLHLHFPMPGRRGCRLRFSLAEVCWNGGGVMAELRFQVWDPAVYILCHPPGDAPIVWGASNHFCRCPGLHERLSDARNLNARGLYDPTRADVLAVVQWCDEKLHELYAAAGMPFGAYRRAGWTPA